MAREDLNRLLDTLLPFAQQMLGQHGEFFPFAASLGADESITHVAATDGGDKPTRLMKELTHGLRREAGQRRIKAAGICYLASVLPTGKTEKVDVIAVHLEDIESEAVNVYLPYILSASGTVEYGEIFASRSDHTIFR